MKEEEISHLKKLIDRLEKEQHTGKANMQEEMKLQVNYIASVRHLNLSFMNIHARLHPL